LYDTYKLNETAEL